MDDDELREMQEELATLRKLIESPGWKRVMAIADSQIQNRFTSIIRTPGKTMDGLIEKEYANGEVAGIELFQRLPEIQVETLKQTIDEELKVREGTNG